VRTFLFAAFTFLSSSGTFGQVLNPPEDAQAREQALTLIGGASSEQVRIIVAENALQGPKEAAAELQRIIKKASGLQWPIVHTPNPRGINVIVGPNDFSEKAGINDRELPDEGYRMAVRGGDLYLVGHDTPGNPWVMHWAAQCQAGTLFAVVGFAREYLDARWVSPGLDGEVIPECHQLRVPATLDRAEAPFFRCRRIQMDAGNPEAARWMRHNRLGWSQVTCFWHNWYQTINPEVYSKDHPTWFALVNGVRQTHLRNGEYDGQLCTSNPEVIQKMADSAVAEYNSRPSETMFSISENDGGHLCECPNCRALDCEDWLPGKPSLSDRLAVFANGVRTAIGSRAKGLALGYYAYNQGELPPVHTQLLPGIVVSDVHNDYDVEYYQTEARAYETGFLVGWRKTGTPMVLTSYFHDTGWWSVPAFAPDALADLIKMSARFTNSLGADLALGGKSAFGTRGNEYYLAAELLWNPDQSEEAIVEDYYRRAFGAAATPIKQYFDLIMKAHAGAVVSVPLVRGHGAPVSWIVPMYLAIQSQADALIHGALGLAANSDSGARRRVDLVATGWAWTQIQTETLRVADEYRRVKSASNAEGLLETWGRRQKFLAMLNARADEWAICKECVTNCDKKYDLNRLISRVGR
jgi:hypothetical protein